MNRAGFMQAFFGEGTSSAVPIEPRKTRASAPEVKFLPDVKGN